jgi:hypothetical protein
MNLYAYIAILSKTLWMAGTITFTDKRASRGTFGLPLDSQCVTGHVLAENEGDAKQVAVATLKRAFPTEQHYGDHENVSVQQVREEVVPVRHYMLTEGRP